MATVQRNYCHNPGCRNEAKKGKQFCGKHTNSLIAAEQGTVRVVVDVLGTIKELQEENTRLREANMRLNQIEADRLRFEQESRNVWMEVDKLKGVNEKLREENARLEHDIKMLDQENKQLCLKVESLDQENKQLCLKVESLDQKVESYDQENKQLCLKVESLDQENKHLSKEVDALKQDPLLLETSQMLLNVEHRIVHKITDDGDFLCDVDLQPGSADVQKSKEHFNLDIYDLKGLRKLIMAIKEPRIAHPTINPGNADHWKDVIRSVSSGMRISDVTIDKIITVAQNCGHR